MDPKTFYDEVMPHKYGDDYEAARWKNDPARHAQFLMMHSVMERFVLPFMGSPKSVLEIGPGPGTWSKVLKAHTPNAEFTLVDISTVMLSQARASLGENMQYVESDWVSFTPKRQYDFFFSSRAFEYVLDKDKALQVVQGALAPGGRGVIITKTPKPLFDRIRGRTSSIHQGQCEAHVLAADLNTAGFRVVGVHPATGTFPGFSHPLLNRAVFAVCSRLPFIFPLTLFSESYVVLFEKS